MDELMEFIFENLHSILSVTVIIMTLLVILNILDINLYNKQSGTTSKVVTIEALKNFCSELPYLSFNKNNFQISKNKSDLSDFSLVSFTGKSFCANNVSNPVKIDNYCRLNNQKNLCTSNSCCGWLNKKQCVGGNKEGPYFHGTQENPLIISQYQYLKEKLNI